MIQHRKSEDTLTKECLLSKVSEYQIFKHFCPPFDDVGKKFTSDLREDNSPTVSIAVLRSGRLWYKDFGYPEHKFDCFGYVGYKYNLTFYETLKHIDMVFGLGLSTSASLSRPIPTLERARKVTFKETVIKVKTRPFNAQDYYYWSDFGITVDILRKFDVHPISHYWINEQRFTCNTISYRYRFDCGYKIYRPLEEDFKWFSNVGVQCIQGYHQLPEGGRTLVLTSSLKDVMCLEVLGYSSIALQSEMLMPRQSTIEEAKARFEEVIVLYDNDFDKASNPGQTMAKSICEEYRLDNLVIPSHYCSKDISDLIRDHGIEIAKHVIKGKENRHSYIEKESTERQS